MNTELLKKHVKSYLSYSKKEPEKFREDMKERGELIAYYQSFTHDKILKMDEEDIYEYISKLWAMLIWGNKHYVVDKIIEENGLENFKKRLARLIWGDENISVRWDNFRGNIKGMGPAMISEILCKTHPDDFMLWNRRAYVGLNYLNVKNLPRYDYQLTGKVYENLCNVCKEISTELKNSGFEDNNLLAVDYFIWEELQVEDNLSKIFVKETKTTKVVETEITEAAEFVHDDIRDKLRDIGQWLGFTASIERKVSEGSKVDTIWESTIGNMGRVIYVFEVQTKGSIDSLILNLLKSLNNPAVQGIVAVSDNNQLERIKKHAADVRELRDKLKYWDYEEVSRIHESLEFVNASINNLGLVPEGF
ncbi:MAG: hypothetical protein JSU85_09565 [Candidatus Zixiibacteriota bacterium]|nr:MAG: hypothetical protein JSU85_09565 [candidate division Zixibacteria bacterium]